MVQFREVSLYISIHIVPSLLLQPRFCSIVLSAHCVRYVYGVCTNMTCILYEVPGSGCLVHCWCSHGCLCDLCQHVPSYVHGADIDFAVVRDSLQATSEWL